MSALKLILACLGGILFILLCVWYLSDYFSRKKLARTLKTLPDEMRQSWHVLKTAGYEIVKVNAEMPLVYSVGDVSSQYLLRVPFVVRRKGMKYLAFVSTAPTEEEMECVRNWVMTATTVFRPKGMLYVDPYANALEPITCSISPRSDALPEIIRYCIIFIFGGFAAYLLTLVLKIHIS